MHCDFHILQYVGDCVFWGGREQHILDLCKGLLRQNCRVTALCRPNEQLAQRFAQSGAGQPVTLPLQGLADWRSICRLAGYIRREKVDVIHAHSTKDAWVALAAKKIARRGKVVLTRHIVLPVKQDWLHRQLYKQLDAIICPSAMVRSEFIRQTPWLSEQKSVVVYNGVDVDTLQTSQPRRLRGDLQLGEQHLLVGYVGRISPEKGVEYLLRAVKRAVGAGADLRLVIVGHGEPAYLDRLQREAASLGARVAFRPFTPEVADVMQSLDVLVLPCIWKEVFGLVLCEAMTCGKVVISTVTGAQREIIDDGVDGFLVPPADEGAIAALLAKAAAQPDWRAAVGRAAQEKVAQKFTQRAMIDALIREYKRLLGR